MKTTFVLAALVLGATSGIASAGTPWIQARSQMQAHRIYAGIQSGQLTYGEARSLVRGQAHVAAMRYQARADGVVTFGERLAIHSAQNVQSARIAWRRHN